jgi:drug/metabolite transporter (DMT)-like permease
VLSILIAMVPMFALAIALPMRLEAPSLRRAVGVALGAVSILLIIGPETALPDPAAAPLVMLGLLIPLLYGVEAIFVALRMPLELHPVGAVFGASGTGFFLLAPLMLLDGVWISPLRAWGSPEWALVLVALLQAACYTGYVTLVGRAGPVFASLVAYLVTISGVLWGLILLDEEHSPWFWAALAIMLAGMALVQPKGREAELV